MSSIELVKKLSNAFGPSGFEDDVRTIIRDELKNLATFSYDKAGSIICKRKGGEGPKFMFAAHMDEIGFLVQHITSD